MINLYIDGCICCTHPTSTVEFSYNSDILKELDDMVSGQSVRISIPATAENDEILCEDGYLHAPQRFNATSHTAEVWYCGERLVVGEAILEEVSYIKGAVWYTILITSQSAAWAEDAKQSTFNSFCVEFDMKLSVDNIQKQWSSSEPVKFVEVRRDSYTPVQSSVSTEMVREIVSLEDYHPFLHVATMLRSIFSTSGYRVESNFLQSDYFESLYMSGSYGSSTNSTETRNAMDFYAKRYEDSTSTADFLGRVYMTPSYVANSVGAMVDAATTLTESDCYSNGGCFYDDNGVPTFKPLVQVYVGFAVRLRYITPYKITDRYSLQTFNKVHLASGHDYEFNVANNFVDHRESPTSTFSYMLCLFDFVSGDDVSLYFRLEDGSLVYHSTITSRVTYIVSPSSNLSEALLFDSSQTEYSYDWALYNGWVTEEGSTEVDVTLRITPEQVSPTSSVKFNEAFIYGGSASWEFTLKSETSITPYFAKHPGSNADITFADIAQIDAFQSSLVESIAHMYNLRFYTDESNKMVYIEPYNDIWDRSIEWDWSDKIDTSYDVEISDFAAETYQNRKWGYRDGDGVTSRGDGDIPADDEFGFWECAIESYAAKSGTESLLSPLYSPSQSTDEGVLQVGDRDDVDSIGSFDFTPRIVRHVGDIARDEYLMPQLSFYSTTAGVSLCFEDRGGMEGLNSYHTEENELLARGRIISLRLRLSPFDVASLFSKCELSASILSLFSFTLGGEQVRCLLKEVVEYDPLKETTLCRFIVID